MERQGFPFVPDVARLNPRCRLMNSVALAITLIFYMLHGVPGEATAATVGQHSIESYAIVREDGTLRMQGKTIRLFGVYLPATGQQCRTVIRPIRCGSRAALALELKIQGFVRCIPQQRLEDGSLSAVCFVRGRSVLDSPTDLGAWLIEQGLAVALPNAPFEYTVLEKIARARGEGIWGFFADEIRPAR